MNRLLAILTVMCVALVSGAEERQTRRPLPPRRIPASTNAAPLKAVKASFKSEAAKPASGLSVVDLLIAFDRGARLWAEWKSGGVEEFARSAVSKANAALTNSQLNATCRFHLAGVVLVDAYAKDVGDALSEISGDVGNWGTVRQAMKEYGADIAVTMIDTGSEYGVVGQSYGLYDESDFVNLADWAFSVCAVRSVAKSHTMTHELGHLFGAGHSERQQSDPGPQLFPYSSGYYFTKDENRYHTIMAYDDDGRGNFYEEAPCFSTPLVEYDGVKVGTETNDNARTLQATFSRVAALRSRIPVVMFHGWNSNSDIWEGLRALLVADAGYLEKDLSAIDFSRELPIEALATNAAEFIDASYPEGQVDVVAHSMGGLVARSMLAQSLLPPGRLRRLITLGTPHYGVTLGGLDAAVDVQSSQMVMGSGFLWNLAEAWFAGKHRPVDTFCVVGAVSKMQSGAYTDGLVPAASAALSGEKVLHVDRYHADMFSAMGKVIYAMDDGVEDVVYRAVKRFLLTGDALDDSMSDCPKDVVDQVNSRGGVLLRVVDESMKSVAYPKLFRLRGNEIIDGIDDKDVDCYYGGYTNDNCGVVSTYADLSARFHKLQINLPKGVFGDKESVTSENRLAVVGGTYAVYSFRATDHAGRLVPLSGIPAEGQYILRFLNSGGEGAMDDVYVPVDSVVSLPPCSFSNHPRRFGGWLGPAGRYYDDGVLVFNLADPGKMVIMSAVWK